MSNEIQSIHEFELELICEYYANFERQGPGSPETTLKALSFIDNLNENSKIADIGCGSGGQTITLAENCPGEITGLDLFPRFINLLNEKTKQVKLEHKLKGISGTMDNLPFQEEELDLIWSEGAIYNIGFENGLKYWRKFLKKNGFVAVSEASWFTEEKPKEIHDFWMDAYPGIDTISNKVEIMQKCGYVPVATFIVPEYCWTKNFFEPQEAIQKAYLKKYKGNKAAEGFIANQQHEAKLYDKYKEYYGYAFYIGKKI